MTCGLCGDGRATACAERVLVYNDAGGGDDPEIRDPIPYGDEPMYESWLPSSRCAECGVTVGNYHHVNCDLEICPKCGDQLVDCDCQPGVMAPTEAPAGHSG